MTRQRNDSHSTEFGLWVRGQMPNQKTSVDCIDSSFGFVTTNLDYIWENYKTGQWLLLEEKRYNHQMTASQKKQFEKLDTLLRGCKGYRGFHFLNFEYTSPEDGKMWLDHKLITKHDLIEFLKMVKEALC
jgi:hypothetical protein